MHENALQMTIYGKIKPDNIGNNGEYYAQPHTRIIMMIYFKSIGLCVGPSSEPLGTGR